ncbi:uncharacterized protein LOC111000845 isoform X1 [Pieris rapae]|uniref:uncharacterized protein LOC111000845 isoform X1 n=1 Tax=Pieris rapae TaxID=64459 RepID=UPI001E27D39C|nr:uncharacterized protein LOC111000845 isoform X1 [Pieris rapae]
MHCKNPLVFAMLFFILGAIFLGIMSIDSFCAAQTPCSDGQHCPPHWLCCKEGCCAPATVIPRHTPSIYDDDWYLQWQILSLLATVVGLMAIFLWYVVSKRNGGIYMCSLSCCFHRNASERDSAGSVYPPPRYSRCGSFHQAPPPYSEVTSKPDLYPLVITCNEGEGKSGGNYLMVHYFRNYVIRAPGSLSATSTAESLNSSYMCNAVNEANTMVPPPYSCASSYNECSMGCGRTVLRSLTSLAEPRRRDSNNATFRDNLINSPVQPMDPSYDLDLELIDCEMYCDGGCKPRLGASPPLRHAHSNSEDTIFDHEAYGIRHLFPSPEAGTCESPPQPTSPTQTSRDSTLRRLSEDRRLRRLDIGKKSSRTRKSSLYMPLSAGYSGRTSRISPGTRISSRSAPATPCGALVPNLLNLTQRVSASRLSSRSSRLEEENDPLLATDTENQISEHKF